ncbi:MAG: cobalamin-dependent protein [Chloroflexi bacterium]|nr:cobalamin-dependent protein [Chloroflexota bacterium]
MSNDTIDQLRDGLLALDMDAALKATNSVIKLQNKSEVKEAVDAVTQALQVVGKRFQEGEWFLAELVYAGEIAKEVMNLLSPLMQAELSQSRGTIVIGTVANDLHDLGKNIFINYARSAGFKVIDLGVNVPTEKFVNAVKEHKPLALGMSCLLTSTEGELGKVIQELKGQNMREKVKVIIGGAALSERVARDISADAFAPDAITGIDIIKGWSTSK